MKKKEKNCIWSKNSNTINIAIDYHKKKQRRKNTKRVAPVTLLCNKKRILFNVDIDKGITIDNEYFFNFEQIEEAIAFVKNYKCNLNFWSE